MSAISGSDSTSNRDEVRRNRDEYTKNESDLIKRHQKEIRRLNEEHSQELEKLKDTHDKQIAEIQKQSGDNVTARDQKYQSEIDNIRSMHRKQLQSTADDSQRKVETLRTTLKNEEEEKSKIADQKVGKVITQSSQDNSDKDQRYARDLQENREQLERGMNEQKQKLERSYTQEYETMKNQRDEKIANQGKEFKDYRNETQRQLRDQEIKHMEDTQRQSDNMIHALKTESQARADAEKNWAEGSGDGLHSVQAHYAENIQKNKDDYEKSREQLSDQVHSRQDGEVRRLRNDNQSMKDSMAQYELQMQRQKEREIGSVKDEFTKNVDAYRMQQDETVRLGNERRKQDIDTITDKNAREMQESNRFYQDKMYEQDRRTRNQYKTITSDYNARNDQIQGLADTRVKNILGETEEEKQRLTRLQQDNHDVLQQQHAEKIKGIYLDADTEKADAIDRIKTQAKQKETAHSEKLAQVQQTFEKQILSLQDQLMRERKANDDNNRRLLDDMNRAHKTDMDQQMAKYDERIRAMQNQQSEELHRVNRANEERLQQVAVNIKKT